MPEDSGMLYVLSNTKGLMGANVMLFPEQFEKVSKVTPTVTITKKNIRINRKLYDRFTGFSHIEFLYHPLLQALIVRTCDSSSYGAVSLNKSDGSPVSNISAEPFCTAVYEEMDWIANYSFKFKGVMRKCENGVAMLFFLDEPQILVGKTIVKAAEGGNYISYRNSDLQSTEPDKINVVRFGVSYALRKRRDRIIKNLSDSDLRERGIVRINPLVGKIPTKEELRAELDELLVSM